MVKRSLIYLFIIALAYVCVQIFLRPLLVASPVIVQSISILYLWSPGLLALYFAYREKLKLPIFAKPKKAFWMIPLVTLLVCLFGFLCAIPFGSTAAINPVFQDQTVIKKVGFVLLYLFTSYLFLGLLFSFVFLGGELYWRGYLLEKWKEKGALRAIFQIALVWSLWQLPITILTYVMTKEIVAMNILFTFALNFILSPVLTYFRFKGGSVFSAALFYSFLMSAYLFYMILFPLVEMRTAAIYGGFSLLGVLLFSLAMRLFFPATWKKIVV